MLQEGEGPDMDSDPGTGTQDQNPEPEPGLGNPLRNRSPDSEPITELQPESGFRFRNI